MIGAIHSKGSHGNDHVLTDTQQSRQQAATENISAFTDRIILCPATVSHRGSSSSSRRNVQW